MLDSQEQCYPGLRLKNQQTNGTEIDWSSLSSGQIIITLTILYFENLAINIKNLWELCILNLKEVPCPSPTLRATDARPTQCIVKLLSHTQFPRDLLVTLDLGQMVTKAGAVDLEQKAHSCVFLWVRIS